MARVLMSAFLLATVVACSSAEEEAASLVSAVEMFHRASNDARPARADAVAGVVCRNAEVCQAKSLCVEAIAETASALRMKRDAESVLAEVESHKRAANDPTVLALPAKLDEASALLRKGHDAMPACDKKILVLRERYGL